MDYLVEKGVSCNIASYVGATTLRIHELAFENRSPTPEELERMKNLVRTAMEEGALGIGSSLIYAPAFYADTEELIELCKVASEYGGSYISHMRSEGDYFLEAIDELMRISKEANLPAEIYHLKAGGKENWHKMDLALAKIDSARNAGLAITADMYNYIAGATGLDASMPPWVQEGGYDEWSKRLKDLEIRKKIKGEIENKGAGWENLYYAAGTPDNLLLVGFKEDSLKYLTGKTLTEVAQLRNQDPVETMMDLVIQDGSRVGTVYFLMNEENLVKQIKKDYVSFCSDAESEAPEGVFLKSNPHPRAYGNFARLLGKYVREENVISLQEAIRRLTSLPASNIKIKRRGSLAPGFKADVVIFDPNEIRDHATFEKPHQYATGVRDVFVNGIQVLSGGEHTGNFPGRVVRGPGWKGQ
jgi:N-acyl-D-amino-acid deacylase